MTNREKDYVTKVDLKSTKQIPLFDVDDENKLIPHEK